MSLNSRYINLFFRLRDEIDQFVENLEQMHSSHINCRKLCSYCCIEFELTAIEFYSIKDELQRSYVGLEVSNPSYESCKFLQNKLCSIYPFRPIRCRTAGLPLLLKNSDNEEIQKLACELNFKDFDNQLFGDDNAFPVQAFQARLEEVNERFIKQQTAEGLVVAESYTLNQIEL